MPTDRAAELRWETAVELLDRVTELEADGFGGRTAPGRDGRKFVLAHHGGRTVVAAGPELRAGEIICVKVWNVLSGPSNPTAPRT
jgi:hypothetical protein